MKQAKILIGVLFLVTGCDFARLPFQTLPPANLTQACPEIAPLAEPADLGDLLRADIELIGQYKECSARQAKLAAWATGEK